MILWSNFHGIFIAGILVLFAFAIGWATDYLLAKEGDLTTGKRLWLALVLSVIGSILNPGLADSWFSILGFVNNQYLMSRMLEANSPNFQLPELQLGIDGFRADAVPYLFEREGTNCENLPETHDYLKRLRAFIDQHYPGRILLCEANQWPEDVRPYFGNGDEFHMGFHFPIMPRIFMSLKKSRADDLINILNRTPPIPDNCQWCTFLRNHDELTLEMVTPEERDWMWEQYAPDPRMKLNLGIRRRLAPLLDNDRRKIELANSLLFTLPGSPIIYYGDEIGMGDNLDLPDRNGVRTPMQWDDSPNAGFTTGESFTAFVQGKLDFHHINVKSQLADKDSLFHTLSKMINVRKQYKVFGRGTMEWVLASNPSLAIYTRKYKDEILLIINNLSDSPQTLVLPAEYHTRYVDLLANREQHILSTVELQPYEYLWLKH